MCWAIVKVLQTRRMFLSVCTQVWSDICCCGFGIYIGYGFQEGTGKQVEGLSKRKLNMEDPSLKWTRVPWCFFSGLGQAKRKL